MGSFIGHAVPGSFFLIMGVRWIYLMLDHYFRHLAKSQYNKSNNFKCTLTYRSSCCPNLPAEGYFKVIGAILGTIGEVYTAFERGRFVVMGNAQHTTMYMFFGINGLVDILIFHGLPLPPGSDYFTLAMACFVEGLLFYFHLHGRTPLDVHVHQLLVIVVAASFIACLVEWKHQNSVLSGLFRAFNATLQGTWFYQIGFILYNPFPGAAKWDPENHKQIMLVTAIFCWHIAAIIVFTSVVGLVVYWRYRPILTHSLPMKDFNVGYEPCLTEVSMESLLPPVKVENTHRTQRPSEHMNGAVNKGQLVIKEDEDDF